MFSWLSGLFGLLNGLMSWLRTKRDQDIGRIIEKNAVQSVVIDEVEKAHEAITVVDATRSKRLHNRFNRAENSQ